MEQPPLEDSLPSEVIFLMLFQPSGWRLWALCGKAMRFIQRTPAQRLAGEGY